MDIFLKWRKFGTTYRLPASSFPTKLSILRWSSFGQTPEPAVCIRSGLPFRSQKGQEQPSEQRFSNQTFVAEWSYGPHSSITVRWELTGNTKLYQSVVEHQRVCSVVQSEVVLHYTFNLKKSFIFVLQRAKNIYYLSPLRHTHLHTQVCVLVLTTYSHNTEKLWTSAQNIQTIIMTVTLLFQTSCHILLCTPFTQNFDRWPLDDLGEELGEELSDVILWRHFDWDITVVYINKIMFYYRIN